MIWPLALGFDDHARVVVALCEATGEVAPFRADRIIALAMTGSRYKGRRQDLLRAWRARGEPAAL